MREGKPEPKGFHGMVYGPPGVGKSTLGSQAPKPCAIIDVDGGSGWLYQDLEDVKIFSIEEGEDPADEVEQFLKEARTGRGRGSQYRSIIIDSLSSLRSRHLQTLAGSSLFYERGDYGVATNWLRRALTISQFAPQFILWITHMKEDTDGPRLVIRPAGLSDTALNHCEELLDAIIYMGKSSEGGANQRFLCTEEIDPIRGRAGIMAKDRTGFLPGYLPLESLEEDGRLPDMFNPFFEEIVKELGYDKPPKAATTKKSAAKKPAAKKSASKK